MNVKNPIRLLEVMALTLILFSCAQDSGSLVRNNPLDNNGTNWNPPVVTAMADASVNIKDSLTITAMAVDNGTISQYVWALDGINYLDTTIAGSIRTAYMTPGAKAVKVKAIDGDGVVSSADTCMVTVTLDPPIVVAMRDTVVNINDSITITAMGTDNGSIVKYVWVRNGGSVFGDTTVGGAIKVAYADTGRKYVIVKVVDDDGAVSVTADTCVVRVTLDPPVVVAMRDTVVSINDSITITTAGTDNGSIVKYLWARNGGSAFGDTTLTGSLKVAYADSGRKNVIVKVVDDDGAVSVKADTCVVRVTLDPPVVTAMAAVSVNIKDSLTITATAVDNGSIAKYVWALDGINYVDTMIAGSIRTAYMTAGAKSVKVKAIDDEGVVSAADTCIVTVTLDPPVVTVIHDTTVSFAVTDSVVVTAHAVDANVAGGSIDRYLWDIGADGVWDDSAATGSRTIKSATGGAITMRWGARDDDGVVTTDTFVVIFNRSPSSPTVTAPTTIAGWGTTFNYTTGKGTLPLTISGTDPDGAVDTLRYTLFTGATAGVLTQQYADTAATYNLASVDSSATVYWRLIVRDKFGDSAAATGSFIAPPTPPPAPAGMKLIAAGTFSMGTNTSANERPVHSVTLSAFWMDSTEVTQADYLALMGINPSYYSGVTRGPVETVTWYDAVLYCNKRSKRDGKDTVYKYTSITVTAGDGCSDLSGLVIDTSKSGYRLPTEAEWEYACRAGTTTDYYWGSNIIGNYAWYNVNSGSTTHPVATKLPNAWGLYDMSGNVYEWCNDWYNDWYESTYSSGAQLDPQIDPQGATSGIIRVVRGGSWNNLEHSQRSAYRNNFCYPSNRGYYVGFRVVCSL